MFPYLNPFKSEPGTMSPWAAARNMLVDPVFYDVFSLNATECAEIVRASAAGEYHEGGMLLVWPAAQQHTIEYFDLSKSLCEAYPKLDAVAVPGVGSSPLGAAAFARQVADVVGRPVVGVIAGYGLADLVSEALGGWFFFGLRNRVQSGLRHLQGQTDRHSDDDAEKLKHDWGLVSVSNALDQPDVNTVLNIMLRQGRKLSLLTAHSKGAMVVQSACTAFEKEHTLETGVFDHLRVATFGCGVSLPKGFSNVSQFVGTWDALGQLNTPFTMRKNQTVEWVEQSSHTLVYLNPFHMPIEQKLGEAPRQ